MTFTKKWLYRYILCTCVTFLVCFRNEVSKCLLGILKAKRIDIAKVFLTHTTLKHQVDVNFEQAEQNALFLASSQGLLDIVQILLSSPEIGTMTIYKTRLVCKMFCTFCLYILHFIGVVFRTEYW